jgi:hypothetical protein
VPNTWGTCTFKINSEFKSSCILIHEKWKNIGPINYSPCYNHYWCWYFPFIHRLSFYTHCYPCVAFVKTVHSVCPSMYTPVKLDNGRFPWNAVLRSFSGICCYIKILVEIVEEYRSLYMYSPVIHKGQSSNTELSLTLLLLRFFLSLVLHFLFFIVLRLLVLLLSFP